MIMRDWQRYRRHMAVVTVLTGLVGVALLGYTQPAGVYAGAPVPPEPAHPFALQAPHPAARAVQPRAFVAMEAPTPIKKTVALSALSSVKQGQVLQVHLDRNTTATKVSVAGKTVPVFTNADGSKRAWIPVKVAQKLGGYTLVATDAAGNTLASQKIEITNGYYSKQNIKVSSSVGGIQASPGELAAIGKLKTDTDPTRQWWNLPLVKPVNDCMNSPFGNLRYHNGTFTGRFHKGVDQRSPMGRPVHATAGGEVKIAQTFRLHGGTVGLDHGQGMSSIYIHLSKLLVKPGQVVQKGQVVGHVGSTGFATGPHLHWGLYIHGQAVNPLQFVALPRC